MKFNFESTIWTVDVIRTRFQCPGLLDFLRIFFLKKQKTSEIWSKYCQWCYRFTYLEGIRLQWLFHAGFGEMKFLKLRDVINSNSWFLAMLKGFSEGLPLFKLTIFLKKYFNKNWYLMCQILTSECWTHPPTHVNLTQTVGRFEMWVTPNLFSFFDT